jgi:hypothetical protein
MGWLMQFTTYGWYQPLFLNFRLDVTFSNLHTFYE